MIHLDTNYVVRGLMYGTSEQAALDGWLASAIPLAVSAPAWAEFLCGPVTERQEATAAEALGKPIPLDGPAAALAAELYNHAGRRRGSLVDCMIAAVAIQHKAQLATANVADFGRFATFGLVVVTG